MQARDAVKALLGPSGYRIYASACGRAHTTFCRSIGKADSKTSLLVRYVCLALAQAEGQGLSPALMIKQSAYLNFSTNDDRSELRAALDTVFRTDSVEHLSQLLCLTRWSVANAIDNPQSRYAPHFRIIATVGLALRRHGRQLELTATDAKALSSRCNDDGR